MKDPVKCHVCGFYYDQNKFLTCPQVHQHPTFTPTDRPRPLHFHRRWAFGCSIAIGGRLQYNNPARLAAQCREAIWYFA